jgi:hypothetical protein
MIGDSVAATATGRPVLAEAVESRDSDKVSDLQEILLSVLRQEYRRARIARLHADLALLEIEEFAVSVRHGLISPQQALHLLGDGDPAGWFFSHSETGGGE